MHFHSEREADTYGSKWRGTMSKSLDKVVEVMKKEVQGYEPPKSILSRFLKGRQG